MFLNSVGDEVNFRVADNPVKWNRICSSSDLPIGSLLTCRDTLIVQADLSELMVRIDGTLHKQSDGLVLNPEGINGKPFSGLLLNQIDGKHWPEAF